MKRYPNPTIKPAMLSWEQRDTRANNAMVAATAAAATAVAAHGDARLQAAYHDFSARISLLAAAHRAAPEVQQHAAAEAVRCVGELAARTAEGTPCCDALKVAARAVRDVFVHRCLRLPDGQPANGDDFWLMAEAAFGGIRDLTLHTQLLLAYRRCTWRRAV